jgi:hypothetical protein
LSAADLQKNIKQQQDLLSQVAQQITSGATTLTSQQIDEYQGLINNLAKTVNSLTNPGSSSGGTDTSGNCSPSCQAGYSCVKNFTGSGYSCIKMISSM